MTRVLLCSVCVLICVLVSSVKCQERNDSGGSWDTFWNIMQDFYDSVSSVVRRAWNDFTSELRARFADFRGWTREAWEAFKEQMNEWVDDRTDINEVEKSEMRKYIERLQMPEEIQE